MEILRNTRTGESLGVIERGTERLSFAFTLEAGASIPAPHRHPASAQAIEVHEGELHLYVEGVHHVLGPGQRLTVPAGVTHYQWNPGKKAVRATESYAPAGRLYEMFATFFRLASEGMLSPGGRVRSPLLVAAFFAEFRGEVQAAPRLAQWALDLLAPLARRLGHGDRVQAAIPRPAGAEAMPASSPAVPSSGE